MGIICKFNKIEHEVNGTEIVQITLPEDLDENNPDYELRGQTIDRELPNVDETITVYNDAYVQIISYMFYKRYIDEGTADTSGDDLTLDLHYRVYESKEVRDADGFNNFLHEDHILNQKITLTRADDIRKLGYDLLKQQTALFHDIVDED